jgi:hypothetical protein
VRSVGRKLARGKCPEMGANRRYDSNAEPTEPPGIKSDRLLGSRLNYVHQRRIEANTTVAQKFLASLS